MKPSRFLLLLFLLLLSPDFSAGSKRFRLPRDPSAYLTREAHWFDQILDHFSPTASISDSLSSPALSLFLCVFPCGFRKII
ncbi:hypothetical protein AXF42_Ash019378 [Apostasia shenzhenica]|uniref:Uncharacterized protein n=1 Tax=Apostasia shenzhenica TaxID=1088818 RepID=A0A2H9ZTM0_9ASPA|nr:hypothetical protein AXF42_Ash019378 [Apostasia shenzhenica]